MTSWLRMSCFFFKTYSTFQKAIKKLLIIERLICLCITVISMKIPISGFYFTLYILYVHQMNTGAYLKPVKRSLKKISSNEVAGKAHSLNCTLF